MPSAREGKLIMIFLYSQRLVISFIVFRVVLIYIICPTECNATPTQSAHNASSRDREPPWQSEH